MLCLVEGSAWPHTHTNAHTRAHKTRLTFVDFNQIFSLIRASLQIFSARYTRSIVGRVSAPSRSSLHAKGLRRTRLSKEDLALPFINIETDLNFVFTWGKVLIVPLGVSIP